MGRLARVVAVDVPHHLTQRGNDRRFILDCDADRTTYLSSLREKVELYRVSVIGYCLMSNHVHLIVVPQYGGRASTGAEADARKIRLLLEHLSSRERTCMARTILFLPLGRPTCVGGIALYGTESVEGALGSGTVGPGLGRALPATAEQRPAMNGCRWSGGAPIGLLGLGESTSPQQGRWNHS
jgi:REP element-mobilizing transposase RayT